MGIDIGSILTEMFAWLAAQVNNWFLGMVNGIPALLINTGNGFFNASINMCTGFLADTPVKAYPGVWSYIRNLATGSIAIGVANDLFVVFFLVTLIDYALAVRSKIDPEDFLKMVAKALLAQWLVFHCVDLVEGLWGSVAQVIGEITPNEVRLLSYVQLPVAAEFLGFLVDVILGLVYAIVMVILSFKIITTFFERFLWAFLAVPFGAPAFATVAGSGRFNAASRAYVRFVIAILVEFIGFAIMVNLLTLLRADFTALLIEWFTKAVSSLDNAFIKALINYFANICFASFVSTTITKLDSKIEKMLAL